MTDIKKEQILPDYISGITEFENAISLTKNEIRNALKNAPVFIRHQTGYLARSEGKNIRATAILTVSMDADGNIRGDAIKVASAVELLHLATLVHDDIIDDSPRRRGIETLHKKFGKKVAVLCGDYLFCLAFNLASSISIQAERHSEIKDLLPKYLTEILMGELRQNKNNNNYDMSEREYFKIISEKTAALFEASFYAGYLLSGEPEEVKSSYLKIGSDIGLIFQLADDCADYQATQESVKKPVLSDFRHGVITLPLIHALKNNGSLKKRILEIEPRELKRIVEASGGIEFTHLKIFKYYSRTKKLINSLDTIPEKKERLLALLDKASGSSFMQHCDSLKAAE